MKYLIFLFSILFAGCIINSRTLELVNSHKTIYDEQIIGKENYYDFGLYSRKKNVYYFSEDSLPRLKYCLYIVNSLYKPIVLYSFSFTRLPESEEIPCKLYYEKNWKTHEYIWLDSLPDTVENRNVTEIIAECSESYYETDHVYINFHIKIGEEEYIRNFEYKRKAFNDFRPKFW